MALGAERDTATSGRVISRRIGLRRATMFGRRGRYRCHRERDAEKNCNCQRDLSHHKQAKSSPVHFNGESAVLSQFIPMVTRPERHGTPCTYSLRYPWLSNCLHDLGRRNGFAQSLLERPISSTDRLRRVHINRKIEEIGDIGDSLIVLGRISGL
jgi:hypothetical protein